MIFISYRRDDSSGHVGRLYDALSAHFGRKRLFFDIDHIAPGQDFDPAGVDRPNVRLSVSRVERRDIERGIALLAEAMMEAQSRSGAAFAAPVV